MVRDPGCGLCWKAGGAGDQPMVDLRINIKVRNAWSLLS